MKRFATTHLLVLGAVACVGYLTACAAAQAVWTDIQTACEAEALASSVIPPGTEVSTVAADVALACDVAEALVPDLEKVVQAFVAAQADAGTAPSGPYVPSPMAQKKKAAKK
jgi:hypothetical protein